MAKKKKTLPELHVVDANNWVNRAFYARPWQSMSTSKGMYTSGIKIFCNMIDSLIREISTKGTAYLVCTWDNRRTETFRYTRTKEWMEKNYDRAVQYKYIDPTKSSDYKGNRVVTPEKQEQHDSLREQLKWCRKICEVAGIPCVQIPDYEGDDCAGTISTIPEAHVFCHTRDKDYAQLISKTCTIIVPEQSNSPRQVWSMESCNEHWGIEPHQMIDYLMLVGDASDNILGVPGIGPKTAVKLLNEYKSVNNLQKQAHTIKGKSMYAKCLRKDEGHIRPPFKFTREMATIVLDVPGVSLNLEDYKLTAPDLNKLKKIKKKLEMTSLIYI